jgi:hypothetical protein
MCQMRTVTLVEAATSAGGYAPGQEQGPGALLDAGLLERFQAAGVAVHRGGRVTPCDLLSELFSDARVRGSP